MLRVLVLSLFASALSLSACKSCEKPPIEAAPGVGSLAAGAQPEQAAEETVDALTPPPPARADLLAPPTVDTMNGHPRGLKQADFDRVHGEGQQKVQDCLDKMPPTTALPGGQAKLSISYEVVADGRPRGVSVTSDLPPEALACAKGAIEALVFPTFEGPAVRNAFSLTYSRPNADLSPK